MKFPGMGGKKAKVADAPEEGDAAVAAAADSVDSAASADAGDKAPSNSTADSTKEGKEKTIKVKPSKKRGPEL